MYRRTVKMLCELIVWNWWKIILVIFAASVAMSAIKISCYGVNVEKEKIDIRRIK